MHALPILREPPSSGVSADKIEAWYDRHISRVLGLARRMMGDHEASDQLVVAVFVEASHSGGTWAEDEVRVRLLQLTQRCGAVRLRQERAGSSCPKTFFDPSRQAAPSPRAEYRPRLLVNAAYFEGYTCDELAAEFGMTADRVAAELHVCMVELAQAANRRISGAVR